VGEDGKTHQCIDYVGLMRNLFGYRIIIPADPNQTDRVIRYIAKTAGNFLIPMGRSTVPSFSAGRDSTFRRPYEFRYGKADVVRDGKDAAIISTGGMVWRRPGLREAQRKGIQCPGAEPHLLERFG